MDYSRLPLHYFLFSAFVVACIGSGSIVSKACPCEDADMCQPLKERENREYEVYAFTQSATNIDKWRWETITTFVAPKEFDIKNKAHANSICMTHQRGKKFGITVDMDMTGSINSSSMDAKLWTDSIIFKQNTWSADVIVINLLPFFNSDHGSDKTDHMEIIHIIHHLHTVMYKKHAVTGATIEISCIIPWKPPCTSANKTCIFSKFAMEACDFFVLSPDSFLDTEHENCFASASIPFSKLVYGISEYNSQSLSPKSIILGVSWHGYDYTCSDLMNDICTLETVKIANSSDTKCNFANKKRLTYTDLLLNHYNAMSEHKQSELYNAPFFNYKNGSVSHQIWFEDHNSLASKYHLVKELSLKGMGIMYGDDLTPSKKLISGDGLLWSWVAHEFLLKRAGKPISHDLHCADTVAGVAVGCLLLGTLLGIVFTCVSMRKKIHKRKEPFVIDTDTEEYTDEDRNL